VVCGFCYLRIFKKRHSISGRSLVLYCIILFNLLGDDFQSIPIFFFLFFINPFRLNFSPIDMQINSVFKTFDTFLFSLICLIQIREKSMTFITSCTNN
jgi:hypothetical protein